MAFKPYHMDLMDLRRFNTDLDNVAFQEKYTKYRNVLTSNGTRPCGMSRDILLLLAIEFQKPVHVAEETVAEESAPDPETNCEPVKRGPGRPRKELQTV